MKRFPSIKSNADFQRGYKRGRSFANTCFVMYVAENSLDYSRLGVSCSKKVGNSVVRHGIARKLREIFRLHKEIELGKDIILVVRQSAKDKSYFDFEKAYLELCSRHHIIGREE
ncbi:ribonuclease P [Oribacterium asaccharolyticum ACB7]|jgi:ribonuclease P protein component|uniref:Ribonuclease P protein component n=1 Tax=Oribacterium asaccharolyticum ACB7 TaxID=796944 RepID=G9WSZ5_9FIRM|nr:ribonuclease P protein component [Oribacterium asaccharolyticum]EHL13365.1 ribonuclease P [Oribacterium asaccharolyticum ACB7]